MAKPKSEKIRGHDIDDLGELLVPNSLSEIALSRTCAFGTNKAEQSLIGNLAPIALGSDMHSTSIHRQSSTAGPDPDRCEVIMGCPVPGRLRVLSICSQALHMCGWRCIHKGKTLDFSPKSIVNFWRVWKGVRPARRSERKKFDDIFRTKQGKLGWKRCPDDEIGMRL